VSVSGAAPMTGAARLRALTLRDFRNIAHAELACADDGIVVLGENGQGKSNLIEAIAYLRLLRSQRGARDRDLIRFGAPAFHVAAELSGVAAHRATAAVDKQGRKKITLDGGEAERLTDALDALPSVSFSPRDVDLVAGSPAERRRYLDITLALTSRSYLNALRHYRGALARRNAALRDAARAPRGGGAGATGAAGATAHSTAGAVAAWEPALAEHGAVLVTQRRAGVAARAAEFAERCVAIGERGAPTLGYAGGFAEVDDVRTALREQLERQREHDIRRCLTHAGPHRDDLALELDGRDLRLVGSAGQQREDEIPEQFTRLARWRVKDGAFTS
jgi:DNA replication and repair protein RecF